MSQRNDIKNRGKVSLFACVLLLEVGKLMFCTDAKVHEWAELRNKCEFSADCVL